jgi:hypothetical protein
MKMLPIVLAAVISAPALTGADPQVVLGEDVDWAARSRVSGSVGVFTPIGEFGFEYTHMVLPTLEIGAGAGVGYLGPQVSLMPRLRTGQGPTSFTFGAGISGGPYSAPELPFFCEPSGPNMCITRTTVLWGNLEVGVQRTWREGMTLRVYGGAGRIVAHTACTGHGCNSVSGLTLPYLGIAIGHTL